MSDESKDLTPCSPGGRSAEVTETYLGCWVKLCVASFQGLYSGQVRVTDLQAVVGQTQYNCVVLIGGVSVCKQKQSVRR